VANLNCHRLDEDTQRSSDARHVKQNIDSRGREDINLMLLYMPLVEICRKNKGPLGDHPRVGNSMNTKGACVTTSSQPLCEVLLQTSNIKQWQEAVAVSRAYA
jgi:hypothetical protein